MNMFRVTFDLNDKKMGKINRNMEADLQNLKILQEYKNISLQKIQIWEPKNWPLDGACSE